VVTKGPAANSTNTAAIAMKLRANVLCIEGLEPNMSSISDQLIIHDIVTAIDGSPKVTVVISIII